MTLLLRAARGTLLILLTVGGAATWGWLVAVLITTAIGLR